MITKWTLSNFKSIRPNTELPLRALTIFSGANSSGKSTVLQSMLLVSQTLASKVSSRSVVLNGPLARLGQFDDLRSAGSTTRHIQVGWECSPRTGAEHFVGASSAPRSRVLAGRYRVFDNIRCDLSFAADTSGVASELAQLQPTLTHFRLTCASRDMASGTAESMIDIRRAESSSAKLLQLGMDSSAGEAETLGLLYDVTMDQDSLSELRDEFASAHPVGCTLRHFLPDLVAVRVDVLQEQVNSINTALFAEARPLGRRSFIYGDSIIPAEVISQLRRLLGDQATSLFDPDSAQLGFIDASPPTITTRQFTERLRRLGPRRMQEVRRSLTEQRSTVAKVVDNSVKQGRRAEYGLAAAPLPTLLQQASNYVDRLFSASLRYVGPLRDEPKPLYPISTTADPADIGIRGEYTAAVLDLHKNRPVEYVAPESFMANTHPIAIRTATLTHAVTEWISYLGLATGYLTQDRGKLGHELKVMTEGVHQPQDLTHVGVGVSQTLPILVTCLLADADTTIIIEQPELHLHPRVQSLLGDFFLAVAMAGRQCIIETHSEYIINRLRLRAAAESTTNPLIRSLMRIYFVEKRDTESSFREVIVNDYGAIVSWPNGFFDQSQAEAEQILLAASRKLQDGAAR